MKFVVGLGNPGEKYENNRHNVGHVFVDYVNEKVKTRLPARQGEKLKVKSFKIVKTDCYMNQSGQFVKNAMENGKWKMENLIIAHDDLDIPFGSFKIQKGTGPKLHNGILSVEKELGTTEFWRIRIGVDNPSTRFTRSGQAKLDGETYVLQNFTPEEQKQLKSIFENIYKQLNTMRTI